MSFGTPDAAGNFTNVAATVTDEDPQSPYTGLQWKTQTVSTIAPDFSATDWCLNLPTEVDVTNTPPSALNAPAITRHTSYVSPDYVNCRQTEQVIESGSAYQVDTKYSYGDNFGNMTGQTVTGSGMTARTTTLTYDSAGQFPIQSKNALGQISQIQVDPNSGRLSSYTDPNGITTSWQYDPFLRKSKETRPDSTSTTWVYNNCTTSGCVNSNNRTTVVQTNLNTNGSSLNIKNIYLDQFDRKLVTSKQMLNGAFDRNEVQYDNQGNIVQQSAPCAFANCTTYWTVNAYDPIRRLVSSQRPISSTNSMLQTSYVTYSGRKTVTTDPLANSTTTFTKVTGSLGRTLDQYGYYVNFNHDAFGAVLSVTDSLSNTLKSFSAYSYGIGAFPSSSTDMDLGAMTYTFDSLGELTAYTDAKSQNFSITYDALSRPLVRTEPDLTTTWTWGTSAASHNIGQLASVSSVASAGTYSESYGFDSAGRKSSMTVAIPVAGSFLFNYGYDPTTGLLASSFFPYGYPSNYRVELAYSYQYGILSEISNALNSGTIWWQATATNPRGQVTAENTGDASGDPRIASNRVYDAVTGWLSSNQTGVGSGAALQNESYLYDEDGNVTQRQNNNLGLTESVSYDHVNRLSTSHLGSALNLSMTYDVMGNITNRSDVASGATWTYDPVHKHQVTQAGSAAFNYGYDANGNVISRSGSLQTWTSYNYPSGVTTATESATFDYGPNRQRWRMIYNGPTGTETTYYATPTFEAVVTSAGTNYRHYIYANGRPVVVISRTTSGAVNVDSLLLDHQGSIATIVADATGATVANESFTPYGNRREASTWSGSPTSAELNAMNGVTREGYTFQTVLGSMGLNHMNGRVEDAVIGRFLSGDPLTTGSEFTQGWNRYSYVNNNPITYIDPSGFCTITTTYTPGTETSIQNSDGSVYNFPSSSPHYSYSLSPSCYWGISGDGGGHGAAIQAAEKVRRKTVMIIVRGILCVRDL